MSAPIQTVDENDQPIGSATKQEAWDQGLIHRVVRLVICNKAGQMLLQHRTPIKDIFPNCWDSAAAGHVGAGEDYDQAIKREMAEELGFDDLELTPLGRYRSNETIDGRIFNRFTQCYVATTERTPMHYEKDKIDGWQWFDLGHVKQMVKEHPEKVTDGLRQIIHHYYL
jgi:16S rRNA (adenine1518-N6/adenine1519-N6)-dimethyltransferase